MMDAEYLSSDRAFDDFIRTRSTVKVLLEDPLRFRWSASELRARLYEEETDRLREQLHPEPPQPKSHRLGRPPALDWHDPETVVRIREMRRVGESRAEMSRHLGVTRNALDTALRNLRSTTNPKRETA